MTSIGSKKSKSSVLIILMLIAISSVLLIILAFKDYNKPKPAVDNTNYNQKIDDEKDQSVITDQNEYINYKYNFGLSFPDYWKGFKAVEKDRIVEFSLENKNKEYIPIFIIGMYYNDEFIKLMEQPGPEPKPMAIDTKGDFTTAYLMKRNDQDLSEFEGIYSDADSMKPYYDVQNNIISTFKYIKKGEVFNDKNKFQKDNEFKLADAKVGDVVAEMTVKFIGSFEGYDIPPVYLSVDALSIGFTGETTITGTYHNNKIDPQTGFGGEVCFDSLDEQSKDKIPSIVWLYEEYTNFCFSNQDLAKENFNPEGSEGVATIVIDEYVINKAPAEVTDKARLVKVISKN